MVRAWWLVLAGCNEVLGLGPTAVIDAPAITDTPDAPRCAGPDEDADGYPDLCDNCPSVANPDQANGDGDDLGDACDPDQPGFANVQRLSFFAGFGDASAFGQLSCVDGSWAIEGGQLVQRDAANPHPFGMCTFPAVAATKHYVVVSHFVVSQTRTQPAAAGVWLETARTPPASGPADGFACERAIDSAGGSDLDLAVRTTATTIGAVETAARSDALVGAHAVTATTLDGMQLCADELGALPAITSSPPAMEFVGVRAADAAVAFDYVWVYYLQ